MKITIEAYNAKVSMEEERDDFDIYEMFDILERLLIANGFNPDSVKDGFVSKAEEINEEKSNV